MSIRVILADDHPVVRQGLRRMLEAEPDFEILAEAGDGLETMRVIEQCKPDVAIVDLMMPALNGLEVTRRAIELQPGIRIIILSMHQDEAYVLQALRRGATGYVLKDSSPNELALAIRQVYQGQRFLSEKLSARMTGQLNDGAGSLLDANHPGSGRIKTGALPQNDPYNSLTEREREVLGHVLKGMTSAEIALSLTISPRTVEVHRASIMRKLNVSTQIDLIRYMIKRGMLPSQ